MPGAQNGLDKSEQTSVKSGEGRNTVNEETSEYSVNCHLILDQVALPVHSLGVLLALALILDFQLYPGAPTVSFLGWSDYSYIWIIVFIVYIWLIGKDLHNQVQSSAIVGDPQLQHVLPFMTNI